MPSYLNKSLAAKILKNIKIAHFIINKKHQKMILSPKGRVLNK